MTDLVNYLFFYNKGEGKELKYGIHYITYIRLCQCLKTMKAQTADDGTGNSDALYIFMYVYKDAPTSIA